ncbi:MAG: MFS transporter [Deinococcales bacterium]
MLERLAQSAGINRQVLALSVARLGDAIGNSILFVIIPLYVAKLPAPVLGLPVATRVGLALSLYGLVAAIGQPIAGALSDRIGRRKPLILVGLVLMAACTLGFTVAGAYGNLLWLRALQGLAVALTIPTSLGTGCVLVGAALVQAWVQDAPVDTTEARSRPFRLFEPGLINRGMLGLGAATFTMAASFSMMGALENEFNARLDQSALAFGVAFSALMVSRLLLQFPVGRWSDRAGRKPFLIAGLILMAPATALLGFAATTGQLVLLRVGQGLASAGIAAPAFALAGDMARRGGEGRQMSIVTTGFGFGLSFGPLLAGALAVASFSLPFVIGGALSLVGAFVVLRFVPESVRRDPPRAAAS